jgi:N-acetylmuramoyl-L-alanine amidase
MTTRELFARMIRCEAEGEGEDGMKAAATVMMNRVRVANGEYQRINQGNLRNVLQQPNQFTCYKTVVGGVPNPQNVWAKSPRLIDFQVADWALDGNIHIGAGGESLWYMNPFVPECPNFFPYNRTGYWFTRINQHCFFNPTASYKNT